MAREAVELGERCGDADLVAGARHQQGRAAIQLGKIAEGIKLLDETMLAVVAGELSPIMTGLMYCSIIEACRGAYECDVRASGPPRCRAGAIDRPAWWRSPMPASCTAPRSCACKVPGGTPMPSRRVASANAANTADRRPGRGVLRQGEIHRLRGEAAQAEECYRTASRRGYEPQPGLALLRLSQGRTDAAAAAIRRLMGANSERIERGRILPAHFEIMLAIGDLEEATKACEELEALRAAYETDVVRAQAAQARGALCARCGDASAALGYLREAFECWVRFDAPYEAARVRLALAEVRATLGDEEASALELDAARATFEQLGARVDLEKMAKRSARKSRTDSASFRLAKCRCCAMWHAGRPTRRLRVNWD